LRGFCGAAASDRRERGERKQLPASTTGEAHAGRIDRDARACHWPVRKKNAGAGLRAGLPPRRAPGEWKLSTA
jgi:hypothetical protein